MKKKIILSFFLSGMILLSACNQGNNEVEDGTDYAATEADATEDSDTVTDSDLTEIFSERDYDASFDESESAKVELTGNGAECSSDAVSIADSTITISDEGTYILTGTLDDGMIIVNAEKTDKVQLVLDNVTISSDTSAPIYVSQADKVFITLADGSQNILTNGGEFVAIDDNNIDAVIFSKDDLTLNGSGKLEIASPAGHGIVSKDELVITGGEYSIEASAQGISGKEGIGLDGADATIVSGTDGVHSDVSLIVKGGTWTVTSGDDALHAEETLEILSGTITVTESYEGIEGRNIVISGGVVDVVSDDDGINAAGGNDQSGYGGLSEGVQGDNADATAESTQGDNAGATAESTQGDNADATVESTRGDNVDTAVVNSQNERGDNGKGQSGESAEGSITISGGKITINASGDGIDSNGSLLVSGGETYVSGPTNDGNGPLDYAGEATITGGIFVAAGSVGMAQNFGSDSTQGAMLVSMSGSANDVITLTNSAGDVLLNYTAQKEFSGILISCPGITQGETYNLSVGETVQEITMDSLIYGNAGGGRGSGGMGNRPDGTRGEKPDREMGEMPSGEVPGGEAPSGEKPTGEMPEPPEGGMGERST